MSRENALLLPTEKGRRRGLSAIKEVTTSLKARFTPNLNPTDFDTADFDPTDLDTIDFNTANFDTADFDTADFDTADLVSSKRSSRNCDIRTLLRPVV